MDYFDRYSTDLKNMDLAYSSYSSFRLDLSKYELTEEKCIDYHRKLMEAQRNNKEKNRIRKNKQNTFLNCTCILLALCPIYIVYQFSDLPFILLWITVIGIWGGLLYVSNKFYYVIQYSNVIYKEFFPPLDSNVERLFDDFLKEENNRINTLFKNHENKS